MTATACPTEETLLAFLDGRLRASDVANFDAHIVECASCQDLVVAAAPTGASAAAAADFVTRSVRSIGGRPWTRARCAALGRGATVGRYVILGQVGRGGMAEVYAAYDPELDRKIALKLMHEETSGADGEDATRARLLREAKSIARLSHPNVIAVYDVGTIDGRMFIAMEFVEGHTLAELMRRRPLSWREACTLFGAAGRGLQAAHVAGLVHRDFKPHNVMVTSDWAVRVMDFGLASDLHAGDGASSSAAVSTAVPRLDPLALTRSGMMLGTPAYMAPEQFEGQRADARTDQFSFCVALYEAIYGERPTIYFGSQFLHKSTDKGASWQIISPDLTTNDPVKIDQSNNGGLTIDITGAENYCTILTIEPSAKDRNVIWVGTDDGNVQLTRDGGKTWTNFRGKIPGMPVGAWVPQIKASRYNAGEAFVVTNDYRRGDFKPYIFRTTDFGKTWTNLLANKNIDGYALCVLQDPVEPNLIFAGSEHGLWVSFDNGNNFQHWKNDDFPAVSTFDLAEQEREGDLVVATFGRAVWILDDIRPLRKMAANNGKMFGKRLTSFETPTAYQASYNAPTGYEWSTYGLWDAENRRRGAEVSYFITPTKDTSSKRTDSLQVKIYNDKNEVIRNLKWKADSGFNRQWWGMEERGFRQPGQGGGRGGRFGGAGGGGNEPGGLQVFPGTYKLVLTYGKESDSTFVTIKDDPRLNKTEDVKIAQRKMLDRLRKSSDKLLTGMDRLTESEEVLTKMTTELRGLQGKEMDSLRKATTAVQDSIKKIREFISGRTSERQGLSRPAQVTVLNTMQNAQQYIQAKSVAPGAQEEQLVKNAESMINEAVKRINNFYATQWAGYRKLVESTKVNLFKDYPPIQ